MSLKDELKSYAYELGADLIGFGSNTRCKHAPIMLSPSGLWPEVKTIVTAGVHHPDACVELGGENHPQDCGPYTVQYMMNNRLDEIAYRLATFLEKAGYGALPIAASNIWRYKKYRGTDAIFAPDVSNIYMAVVTGLAEVGFSGLALTPEYGPRNRFVTVITDAEIPEDPLLPPGSVCDRCMLCRKHCPAQALSKEIAGEKVLKIDPYEYRFPDKNLWRCSWGEHFGLDLDLEIPEVVDDKVLLEKIREHGARGGEMGQCLKYCVPAHLRAFDKSYSQSPVRKLATHVDHAQAPRALQDRTLAAALAKGAEYLIVTPIKELEARGINAKNGLPGAQSAVTVVITYPQTGANSDFSFGAYYLVDSICYDLARAMEALGFRSVMTIERSGSQPQDAPGRNITGRILAGIPQFAQQKVVANTVITEQEIPAQMRGGRVNRLPADYNNNQADLTNTITDLARAWGADLVGVASVDRLNQLARQLEPVFNGEEILVATNNATNFTPWEPVVARSTRKVKKPADYLPDAQAVLVLGLRLHRATVQRATKPPAEAVGPYAFQTYITNWLAKIIGTRLVQRLAELGYAAVITTDLTGTASQAANPRGLQPDLRSNRFAAIGAGLGYLTDSGYVATPEFGIRQRFIAVVTNAPLRPSPLSVLDEGERLCDNCDHPCVTYCPTRAFGAGRIDLACEGYHFSCLTLDSKRCDWAKRYTLRGDCGNKYTGSPVDIPIGKEEVTPASLTEALRQHNPMEKHLPANAEPCIIKCPYGDPALKMAGQYAGQSERSAP